MNKKISLSEYEKMFNVRPVGIKYTCEFCKEGEMIYSSENPLMVETLLSNPPLHLHKCNKCGKTMQLPKVYPYIEWIPEDDDV